MATKREELQKLERGEGCLAKAADNEPIFILVAHDLLAPSKVLLWAADARAAGCPAEKVEEAVRLAAAMQDWQHDNGCKVPD